MKKTFISCPSLLNNLLFMSTTYNVYVVVLLIRSCMIHQKLNVAEIYFYFKIIFFRAAFRLTKNLIVIEDRIWTAAVVISLGL